MLPVSVECSEMVKWIMRIVGAANIAFCAVGLIFFAWSLSLHWGRWPGSPSSREWTEFFILAIVSLFLLGYSAYFGVRLLKNDISVVPRVNFIFAAEIIYLFFIGSSWATAPNNPRMTNIVVVFWGTAEAPLEPLLAYYYPFIALLVMLVVQVYIRKQRVQV